jgi:hypothetical protein
MATSSGGLLEDFAYEQYLRNNEIMEDAKKGFPPFEAFKRLSEVGKMLMALGYALALLLTWAGSPLMLFALLILTLFELSNSWDLVGTFWHNPDNIVATSTVSTKEEEVKLR